MSGTIKDFLRTRQETVKKRGQTHQFTYTRDERLFTLTREHAGKEVLVAFLRSGDETDLKSFARHTFPQNGRGWRYIEPCMDEQDCPLCRRQASEPLPYVYTADRHAVNIVVVEDPIQPENEGKTFIFEFGAHIVRKLEAADAQGVNPFDPRVVLVLRPALNRLNMLDYRASSFETCDDAMYDPQEYQGESLASFPVTHSYDERLTSFNRVCKGMNIPMLEQS